MGLVITCWNVQRLNLSKAVAYGTNLKDRVDEVKKRWQEKNILGFYLENQADPTSVRDCLAAQFGASFTFASAPLGGQGHTAENIIYFHAGDVRINSVKVVPVDLAALGVELGARAAAQVAQHAAATVRLRDRASLMPRSAAVRTHQYQQTANYLRDHEWYRGALVLNVTASGRTYTIAAVHCPGPDHMQQELWDRGYSKPLRDAGVDLVIGDFNLPGELKSDGWKDFSHARLATGTTTGRKTNEAGSRKWDKVLVSSQATCPVGELEDVALGFPATRDISDHAAISIVLSSQAVARPILLTRTNLVAFLGLAAAVVAAIGYGMSLTSGYGAGSDS